MIGVKSIITILALMIFVIAADADKVDKKPQKYKNSQEINEHLKNETSVEATATTKPQSKRATGKTTTESLKDSTENGDNQQNENNDGGYDDDDDNSAKSKEAREKVKKKNKNKAKKPKRKLSAQEKDKYKEWKKSQKKSLKKGKPNVKSSKNDTIVDDDLDEEAAENYIENDERIEKHNQADSSFKLGHNRYSDRSVEENLELRGGMKVPNNTDESHSRSVRQLPNVPKTLPKARNYTRYMKPVKDQKDCGACYAFSALAAVEYEAKIANKNNTNKIASEQDIIDCDTFSYGCDGGWPTRALQYARDFGICDGAKYKYANSRQLCQRRMYNPIMRVNRTCEEHLKGNETRLMELVALKPIVVGFAITVDFMYYKSGIFSDPKCPKAIDHAMLVVGYGYNKASKKNYWIVRNSWSQSWGMRGYGLVEKNAPNGGNMCGIATYAMYVC